MIGNKGFTLMEIMMVIFMVGVLSVIAIPMYADYTKKARTAEVPTALKSLAQVQIGYYETYGRYATALLSLGWQTSKGLDLVEDPLGNLSYGSTYSFSVSELRTCDFFGTGAGASTDGLAMATAISGVSVPDNFYAACMNADLDFLTNSD